MSVISSSAAPTNGSGGGGVAVPAEYDQSRVTRRDPKYLWVGKYIRDWQIDETIKNALQSLTKGLQYFQLDPYKSLLHALRCKESLRVTPTLRTLEDIPKEPDSFDNLETVPFVRVGDTSAVVMKHLFRIIGLTRLKYCLDILAAMKVCIDIDFTTIVDDT